MNPTTEAAFETVIETHLPENGYVEEKRDDQGRKVGADMPQPWTHAHSRHPSRQVRARPPAEIDAALKQAGEKIVRLLREVTE